MTREGTGWSRSVPEVVAVDVVEAVRASSLAVLAWVDPEGLPRARGVVALVHAGRPAVAFTYADERVARAAAAASRVSLGFQEARSTGTAFRPAALVGRPRLTEDPAGRLYVSELALEELRRYPPSRLYADSPLLMREHWWYLPRLVVDVDVDTVAPLSPRSAAHDHLLVVADGATPVLRSAGFARGGSGGAAGGGAARLALELDGPAPPAGPALLFGQDASFPDLEQWSQWSYRGRWDGEAFTVDEAPARTGLEPPPGLLQRWRRQRALERGCVAAIPRPDPR